MTLEQYLEKRRIWEVCLGLAIVTISFLANLGVEAIERSRYGGDANLTQPFVLEATSHLALLAAVPFLLWFDRKAPLRANFRIILAHLAASVVFSVIHVVLMYWARVATFAVIDDGERYRWHNWLTEFGYEYLKDFRSYFLMLALVYLYRLILRRLQGEAGFLKEARDEKESVAVSDRFLVKKFGREFLVQIRDIDWVESCGNYVSLHVSGKSYLVRDTMNRIHQQLAAFGFERVHRKAIVNLDRIEDIETLDSGDGRANLLSGASVPVSRRYKQQLRDRLL